MTNYAAGLMAQCFACNAQVEAMKAENVMRNIRQESPAYGEDSFMIVAHFVPLTVKLDCETVMTP